MPSADQVWASGVMPGRQGKAPEVLFGQMREDAAVELAMVWQLPAGTNARVFCVASGGCTALSLLAAGAAEVTAVDVNPAQVELVRLKLALLKALDWEQFLEAVEKDCSRGYELVRKGLGQTTREFWDQRRAHLSRGLVQCGLADRNLARGAALFRALCHNRVDCMRFLMLDDPQEQRNALREWWKNAAWRTGFDALLSQQVLSLIFGGSVSAQFPKNFGRMMRMRMERAMVATPARDNPFLWQLFLQEYPPAKSKGLPWLGEESHERMRARLGAISIEQAEAAEVLDGAGEGAFHLVVLSNILELASREEMERTLRACGRGLTADGCAVLRFILPNNLCGLQPETLGLRVDWEATRMARALERGPFCTEVFIFRRVTGT